MDKPNVFVPMPSPLPAPQALDSSGLEITPEKKLRKRNASTASVRPRKFNLSTEEVQLPLHEERTSTVTQLGQPRLNSTGRLYNKIQELKGQRQNFPSTKSSAKLYTALGAPQSHIDLRRLPGSKPLKELNIPRHVQRYSNLVPVDVSEESFHKLTKIETKRKAHASVHVSSGNRKGQSQSEEAPSFMEFYKPDFEWQEAEWTLDRAPSPLAPVFPNAGDSYLLYDHIHML